MSKFYDVEKMYGQDFSIVTSNAPSNVIKDSKTKLLSNVILLSSPKDKKEEQDNNYPSLFATDYNGNPLQLTYPLYLNNGLSMSDELGYVYLNIDNKSIKTNNNFGYLFVDTNELSTVSLQNKGVVKIANELSGNERTSDYPYYNTYISANDNGVLYIGNDLFQLINEIVETKVNKTINNLKMLLNNNLKIWIELTDAETNTFIGKYNLNTLDKINIDYNTFNNYYNEYKIQDKIITLNIKLNYLSFNSESENVSFLGEGLYDVNVANISSENIDTLVEPYEDNNDQIFKHYIEDIKVKLLPNYNIDDNNIIEKNNVLTIVFNTDNNDNNKNDEQLIIYQPGIENISTYFNITNNDIIYIKELIDNRDSIESGNNQLTLNINNKLFKNFVDDNGDNIIEYSYNIISSKNEYIQYNIINKTDIDNIDDFNIINTNIYKDILDCFDVESNHFDTSEEFYSKYITTTDINNQYKIPYKFNLYCNNDNNYYSIEKYFIIDISRIIYKYILYTTDTAENGGNKYKIYYKDNNEFIQSIENQNNNIKNTNKVYIAINTNGNNGFNLENFNSTDFINNITNKIYIDGEEYNQENNNYTIYYDPDTNENIDINFYNLNETKNYSKTITITENSEENPESATLIINYYIFYNIAEMIIEKIFINNTNISGEINNNNFNEYIANNINLSDNDKINYILNNLIVNYLNMLNENDNDPENYNYKYQLNIYKKINNDETCIYNIYCKENKYYTYDPNNSTEVELDDINNSIELITIENNIPDSIQFRFELQNQTDGNENDIPFNVTITLNITNSQSEEPNNEGE